MAKYMMKLMLLFALLLLLGCGIKQPTPAELDNAYYGPEPENYQEIIKNYMRLVLIDPVSALYEFPNSPRKVWVNRHGQIEYGWGLVCLINAKNRMGGYTGFQSHQFVICNGTVIAYGNFQAGYK